MQISIINKSGLERTLRIDSEYYQPAYIAIEKIISKLSNVLPVTELCHVSDGNHMSIAEHFIVEDGIPYYRGQDITDFFLENVNPVFIPNKIYNTPLMKRSHFKVGDVLLSIVGTIGNLSLVTENIKQATGSCKIAILRPQNIISEYLAIYLMSRYGNEQIKRNTRGAVQTGLILEDFSQIYVVTAAERFQKLIGDIVNKSLSHNIRAHSLYEQAEQILLSELGLLTWKPKHCLSFIKNFSDTKSGDRIDAEYFQPMYEEIVKTLRKNFQAKLIGEYDFIDITTGQYSDEYVLPSEGKPYIRGTDLSKGTVSTEFLVYIDKRKQEKSKIAKEGDVVVTRVGTIGLSARIPKECDGGTISDNLIRLRFDSDNLNTSYTALYLGSIIGRNLMIENSRGSVQQRLNQETLKEIIFPILKMDIQNKIAEVVLMSDAKRKESKLLLDIAKRGVEIAIEKSEKDAEKWIAEEMNK